MKVIRQCTEIIGVIERGDAAHDLTLEIEKVLKACQDAAGPKTKVKGRSGPETAIRSAGALRRHQGGHHVEGSEDQAGLDELFPHSGR